MKQNASQDTTLLKVTIRYVAEGYPTSLQMQLDKAEILVQLCSQYTTERDNCLQNIFIGNDSLLHILE
jgi:hypothetical protein